MMVNSRLPSVAEGWKEGAERTAAVTSAGVSSGRRFWPKGIRLLNMPRADPGPLADSSGGSSAFGGGSARCCCAWGLENPLKSGWLVLMYASSICTRLEIIRFVGSRQFLNTFWTTSNTMFRRRTNLVISGRSHFAARLSSSINTISTHCVAGVSNRAICFLTRISNAASGTNRQARGPTAFRMTTRISWSLSPSKALIFIMFFAKTSWNT
mmetsp:Transcript_13321/g.33319  ORF Transcript_13321/g.33319 Transcript_13321/m.33319 type:complete len:211 (+) Transcript_13321:390-1022(+)